MNIDLLITSKGEAGLLASENFVQKVVGVLLDTDGGHLSLEFVDMDHMDLNIPVEEEFFDILDRNAQIHIGAVKDGKIAQAYQTPLMFLDDPYRAHAYQNALQNDKPLAAFQYFVKACTLGQPVHRDDTSDESTLGCILGEAQPSSLEFAPHLARRLTFEIAPSTAPTMGPGLGLGGSSGNSSARIHRNQQNESHKKPSDKKGDH